MRIIRLIGHALFAAPRNAAGDVKRFLGAKFRNSVFDRKSNAMTLSVEEGHARLLVLKRGRIIAWRSGQTAQPPADADGIPGEPETERPDTERPDTEKPDTKAFNPLGPLLEDLPARAKRVVADLPLHVPLLRHVALPDVKLRFITSIVENEVLDSVPFAADEIDIRWRIEEGGTSRRPRLSRSPRTGWMSWPGSSAAPVLPRRRFTPRPPRWPPPWPFPTYSSCT